MARRDIISISIDPELNENINKYMASQKFKHSKSYYIEQAIKMYLNQDGYLAFEIGFNQKNAVENILEENGYNNIYSRKDLSGNDRIVVGQI